MELKMHSKNKMQVHRPALYYTDTFLWSWLNQFPNSIYSLYSRPGSIYWRQQFKVWLCFIISLLVPLVQLFVSMKGSKISNQPKRLYCEVVKGTITALREQVSMIHSRIRQLWSCSVMGCRGIYILSEWLMPGAEPCPFMENYIYRNLS